MDRDISFIMIPTLAGPGNDEFGAEKDTKRPLLLDSVMEGKPCISGSQLLKIPAEILAIIVDFIADDKPTLAALALVNSDCRQLARSCQFVDICFDYSPQAFGLLRALLHEAGTRDSAVSQPTIGACIRRITVKSHRHWVVSAHWELYESIFGDTSASYTKERKIELREQATENYLTYRSDLLMAISAAMPHIETIAWYDKFSVDAHFFRVITHSPIKHLKLSRVPIEEPYLMEPPLTPTFMELQSLDIDVRLSLDRRYIKDENFSMQRDISVFFKGLLLRCAPTLKSLTLRSIAGDETISLGDARLSFPRLQHLNLSWLRIAAPSLLLFFPASLRQLALPSSDNRGTIEKLLANCEPMRGLETLVMPGLNNPKTANAIVSFLEKHVHLQKLCIEQSLPTVLDSHIIPLLSAGMFSNLLSLSLSWSGPGIEEDTEPHIATIADESIAAIGTITSLEQLCLTAGVEIGWRCQWLVDHEILRENLKGLTRFKKLAICRDTYRILNTPDVEAYYSEGSLLDGPWYDDSQARPELDEVADDDDVDMSYNAIWERAHRNRMLRQAEKYAAAIPSLEWIYCGQWPMAIQKRGNETSRAAVPLSKARDTCYTALSRMFAMGDGED